MPKKVTNIQIVNHPYLGGLSKNIFEVFHDDIANLDCGVLTKLIYIYIFLLSRHFKGIFNDMKGIFNFVNYSNQ